MVETVRKEKSGQRQAAPLTSSVFFHFCFTFTERTELFIFLQRTYQNVIVLFTCGFEPFYRFSSTFITVHSESDQENTPEALKKPAVTAINEAVKNSRTKMRISFLVITFSSMEIEL